MSPKISVIPLKYATNRLLTKQNVHIKFFDINFCVHYNFLLIFSRILSKLIFKNA